MLDKFADELREARTKNNISLQQMAAKTRIDIKFLEALDNGNFSFLPELYVKAFIKQYARVVGLDENETVKRYDLAREGRLFEKEPEPEAEIKPEPEAEQVKKEEVRPAAPVAPPVTKQEPKKVSTFTDDNVTARQKTQTRKTNLNPFFAGVGVVAVLVAAVYFIFIQQSSKIVVEEKPFDEVLEQTSAGRFTEEQKANDSQQALVSLDSLILQVANVDSTDSAWVLIIYDDVVKGDFLLYPRSSKTIKAARLFRITLGNSGVIRFTLNKSVLQFEGRRGSVRHFKIDKDGIERLYSPPTLMQ